MAAMQTPRDPERPTGSAPGGKDVVSPLSDEALDGFAGGDDGSSPYLPYV